MKELNQHLKQIDDRLQQLEKRIQSVSDNHDALLLVLAYLLDQLPDHAGALFLYNQMQELGGEHESHFLHEIYELLCLRVDAHEPPR